MKPTERQIKFAEAIAEELRLELPEFDKREYSEFITANKDDYYESIREASRERRTV